MNSNLAVNISEREQKKLLSILDGLLSMNLDKDKIIVSFTLKELEYLHYLIKGDIEND